MSIEQDISLSDASLERIPPQSIEAEQAVLGALLVNGDVVSRVVDIVQEGHFYRKAHQVIYAAMIDLFDKNEPVDIVTVAQYLKDEGKLDNVGGRQYLTDLAMSVATTANVEYYAKVVAEKSLLRNLIRAGTEIVGSCYDDQDADVLLDKAERLIFGLAETRKLGALIPIREIVEASFTKIEERYQNRDSLSGIPSGFYDLDDMTSGFQPSDLVIVAARPSMGKCLAYDSEIVLADGNIATIEEVYKRKSASLLTLGADLKLRWTQPSAFVDDGLKPTFKVTTRLGRSVESTLSHPFLTIDGWKKLSEVRVGERIAVPRRVEAFGNVAQRECEVKLLAYLIGDGCLTNGKVGFTNANPVLQMDFEQAVMEFGNVEVRREKSGARVPSFYVRAKRTSLAEVRTRFSARLNKLLSGSRGRARQASQALGVSPPLITLWKQGKVLPSPGKLAELCAYLGVEKTDLVNPDDMPLLERNKNGVRRWLQQIGLWRKSAHNKAVPACVFRLPAHQLALFLNRLFATDGWATVLASGQSQLGYASVSEKLARQIQHLLLRFGVIAKLKRRQIAYRDSRRNCWQLDITDSCSIRTFLNEIGIFGKEQALERVSTALSCQQYGTNQDVIPLPVWNRLRAAKGAESWASLARRAAVGDTTNIHVGKRAPTRTRLRALADALGDSELRDLATSDVYWDEIVSIKPTGIKQVYDLTVPETHNFVANDICVHNTALCLNIAQHVAVESNRPVAVFSLEMSREQLVSRMLCSVAEIDAHRLRTGFLHNNDWQRLALAMGKLAEAPIYIDDSAVITALDIRAKCRRLKAEMKDLGLVIIDYIQLMQGRKVTDNRVQEVSEISRSLKTLARELSVPVIALSQLSRAVEQRQNKRPMLSDLRESGSIEQDADIVMFIYRDEYYNTESEQRGEAEIIVAKQRNGPVGTVNLLYQGSITRFLNKVRSQQYTEM